MPHSNPLSPLPSATPTFRLILSLMPKYNYVAMDAHGKESKGTLEAASQNEAIGRVKEMNLLPTKTVEVQTAKDKSDKKRGRASRAGAKAKRKGKGFNLNLNIKSP